MDSLELWKMKLDLWNLENQRKKQLRDIIKQQNWFVLRQNITDHTEEYHWLISKQLGIAFELLASASLGPTETDFTKNLPVVDTSETWVITYTTENNAPAAHTWTEQKQWILSVMGCTVELRTGWTIENFYEHIQEMVDWWDDNSYASQQQRILFNIRQNVQDYVSKEQFPITPEAHMLFWEGNAFVVPDLTMLILEIQHHFEEVYNNQYLILFPSYMSDEDELLQLGVNESALGYYKTVVILPKKLFVAFDRSKAYSFDQDPPSLQQINACIKWYNKKISARQENIKPLITYQDYRRNIGTRRVIKKSPIIACLTGDDLSKAYKIILSTKKKYLNKIKNARLMTTIANTIAAVAASYLIGYIGNFSAWAGKMYDFYRKKVDLLGDLDPFKINDLFQHFGGQKRMTDFLNKPINEADNTPF